VAILSTLVGFCYLLEGFTNHQLQRVTAMRQAPYTGRQATYDLRRLKRKGLIQKIQGTHRYQLTALGRGVAVLFTKTYSRVLTPGLSVLDLKLPEEIAARGPLATAWRCMQRTLDGFIEADDCRMKFDRTFNFRRPK
jgi:hypothetical protein